MALCFQLVRGSFKKGSYPCALALQLIHSALGILCQQCRTKCYIMWPCSSNEHLIIRVLQHNTKISSLSSQRLEVGMAFLPTAQEPWNKSMCIQRSWRSVTKCGRSGLPSAPCQLVKALQIIIIIPESNSIISTDRTVNF